MPRKWLCPIGRRPAGALRCGSSHPSLPCAALWLLVAVVSGKGGNEEFVLRSTILTALLSAQVVLRVGDREHAPPHLRVALATVGAAVTLILVGYGLELVPA